MEPLVVETVMAEPHPTGTWAGVDSVRPVQILSSPTDIRIV